MLLSPRKNGLTSLFEEVRVFKAGPARMALQLLGNFLAWHFSDFCPGMLHLLLSCVPKVPGQAAGSETFRRSFP